VTFILEDRAGHDFAYLAQNTQAFMEALRKRPEFRMVTTTLIPTVPQLHIDVDRDKVLKQGVDLKAVYDTLQTFMGGYFVNYFNRFGRQWQMYVQADGDYRTNADNVGLFFVRDGAGNPVPLSSLVKVEKTAGPEFSMRYNLYRSAQINAMMAPGYSSGQAMAAMEEVFHDTMPSDMGYDYLGMSFQEKMAQQGVSPSVIFALSFLFVFLILAAQYESWSLPFSVLLSTPIAVFGAFLAVWIRGQENNIYAQIGLVMLIGLAAKNAILIVEFARMEYEGKSLRDAALEAARLRLRPLLMTAFAFILGSVPLAISEGAGGHSRQIMGTVVIGGMLAATLLAIFIIPVLFTLIGRFTPRRSESAEGGEPPAAPEHHAQQTGQP
jgi:HAE1 family hydrophobic/amphiphilic exporter-1